VVIATPGADGLVHAIEIVGGPGGAFSGWAHHDIDPIDFAKYGPGQCTMNVYTMDMERLGGVCRCRECAERRDYIRNNPTMRS